MHVEIGGVVTADGIAASLLAAVPDTRKPLVSFDVYMAR